MITMRTKAKAPLSTTKAAEPSFIHTIGTAASLLGISQNIYFNKR